MTHIDQALIKKWDELKNKSPGLLKKSKPSPKENKELFEEAKKEVLEKLKKLYKSFDEGFKKQLIAANKAKTDKDALLLLNKSRKTAKSYQKKTLAAQKTWGTVGQMVPKTILAHLKKVEKACEDAIKSLA